MEIGSAVEHELAKELDVDLATATISRDTSYLVAQSRFCNKWLHKHTLYVANFGSDSVSVINYFINSMERSMLQKLVL